MSRVDLIVRNGSIVDTDGGPHRADLGITEGRIVERAPRLARISAARTIDADGKLVLPGIVDPHVHLSKAFGCAHGQRLLAAAGVTTAVDFAGPVHDVFETVATQGAGLLIGSLEAVAPGRAERNLAATVEGSLAGGALGVKVLGGHFPLHPESISTLADIVAARKDFLLAVHAGSTRTPGDFEGMQEAITLLGDAPAYLAHLNSYVRGEVHDDAEEASRAIESLRLHPSLTTECYLSTLNGCPAEVVDGALASAATARHLRRLGYADDSGGLEAAIGDGQGGVVSPSGELTYREHGIEVWRAAATRTMVCLPVNHLGATLALLNARRDGAPLVAHLCSDGGGIPRNVTLPMGLTLVDWQVMTMQELLQRAIVAPARMLGLDRGRLQPGDAADLVVLGSHRLPEVTIAGGAIVFRHGEVIGHGGRVLVTSDEGHASATERGLTALRTRMYLPSFDS